MTEINQILNEKLVNSRAAAHCLNLPLYLLSDPKERRRIGLPHYRVGKMVRFKVSELMTWLQEKEEVDSQKDLPNA
jgi:hypothetical protein